MTLKSRIFGILQLDGLGAGLSVAKRYTASGAITRGVSFVELHSNGASLTMTLTKPKKGQVLVITQSDAGTDGHTVTLASGTFNGSNNVATFNAQSETLVLFAISDARFVIVENIGSVALS